MPRPRRTAWIAGLVSAAALAPLTVAPASGHAHLEAGPADIVETGRSTDSELQERVAPHVRALYLALEKTPGYTDLRINLESRGIDVLYHGEFPSSARDVVDRAARAGIPVNVVSTPISQVEAVALASALAEAAAAQGDPPTGVVMSSDYTLVEVSGDIDHGTKSDLRGRARATSRGLEVRFTPAERAVTTHRQDDHAPYSGGARITGCTSGFSMYSRSASYLLTAAHCANWVNGATFRDGAGAVLGKNSWTPALLDSHNLDATLISVSSNSPRIYTSTWSSNTTTAINGSSGLAQGQQACISGATLGIQCDGARTYTGIGLKPVQHGSTLRDVRVFTMSVGGSQAQGASGDSGGPVYRWDSATNRRYAVGIVSAGLGAVSCPAQRDTSVRATCYKTMYITPISDVLNVLDNYQANSVYLEVS